MSEIKIIKEESLHKGRYELKKYSFERKTSKGKVSRNEREIYDHGPAVTALLYDSERRKILFTKQFRLPVYLNGENGELLEPCAGLVENKDGAEETMLREIKEETGYEVKELKKIFEGYTSAGFSTEKVTFFIAPYHPSQKVEEGGGLEEEGEDIKLLEMSYEEALEKLDRGEFRDVKALVLLQYLRSHLF